MRKSCLSLNCREVVEAQLVRNGQLQILDPQLDQVGHKVLPPLTKCHAQHQQDEVGNRSVSLLSSPFDNFNSLQEQELAFLFLLRLEGATPGEQPAEKRISLCVLHVEVVLQLLPLALLQARVQVQSARLQGQHQQIAVYGLCQGAFMV